MSKRALTVTVAILVAIIILILLMYPTIYRSSLNDVERIEVALLKSDFEPIEDDFSLAYNKTTKIIYYFFGTYEPLNERAGWMSFMAPYISENGYFCKYVNDTIVEVIPNNE